MPEAAAYARCPPAPFATAHAIPLLRREERWQRVRKAAAKSECMAASGGALREGCLSMPAEGGLPGAAMSRFLHDFLVLDTRYPYLSGESLRGWWGQKCVPSGIRMSECHWGHISCPHLPIKTHVGGLMTWRNRRLPDGRDSRMVRTTGWRGQKCHVKSAPIINTSCIFYVESAGTSLSLGSYT